MGEQFVSKAPGIVPPAHAPEMTPPVVETTSVVAMDTFDWEAAEASPEFKELISAKQRFIIPMTIFFLVFYFALPVIDGYFKGFARKNVFGNFNVAYLFALAQFVMTFVVAYLYIKKADSVFDRLAAVVVARMKKEDRA
ncbi:MAG: DUF485 domain-containing protein [Thermomicrobiales bacterium]